MTDRSKLKKSIVCGSTKEVNNQEKPSENNHCAFEDLDHSLLQHPLSLGVTNVKQILKCIQNGSKEVKDILLNECNIVYECKVCASLFRSLANFLYHKRCYCKKHLCEGMLLFENFEEESELTVQPESDQIPTLIDCSVKLVRADIPGDAPVIDIATQEETIITKEKMAKGKGGKVKEQKDNDDKKAEKEVKVASPMISRRTREKKSMNITKRTVNDLAEQEQPKKITKLTNKASSASRLSSECKMIVDKKVIPEKRSKSIEEKDKCRDKFEKKINSKEERMECLVISENTDTSKEEQVKYVDASKQKIKDEEVPSAVSGKKIQSKEEHIKMSDAPEEKDKEEPVELSDVSERENKEQKVEISDVSEKETIKTPLEPSAASEMVTKPDEEQMETDKVQQNVQDKDGKEDGEEKSTMEVEKVPIVNMPKQMHVKPLKKVIITQPKSVNLQNINVFDGIRKNINTNKIGLASIGNVAGKGLQCLPKVIFKAIDGNPHAVFQSTDNAKSPKLALKNKPEKPAVNKIDREKRIVVMKKDPPNVYEFNTESVHVAKSATTRNEFHLTRRKKLLARSDCNVQELRCLNCKSQFTSLKTLYFHMLSLHSKKRLYFPCPFCKALFVQVYGVTRHLRSSHNKSKEQINKLRGLIKKKGVWKKVEESKKEIPEERKSESSYKEEIKVEKSADGQKERPNVEVKLKAEPPKSNNTVPAAKTVGKLSKDLVLHQCSKCGRVFGRKSSQVSHEKFCIMNAIKVESIDNSIIDITPPPNMSFFSLSPTKRLPGDPEQQHGPPSDIKVSSRPKRGAEKQMHKDFVNSQTLKWRSANRVDTAPKPVPIKRKKMAKSLEKKVLNIMSVENLLCTKCDKKFSSYSNLRRHVAIHVGWTRFKCKYCEYQAYNKSQCWGHVLKAHSVPEEDLEKSVVNLGNKTGHKICPPVAEPVKSPEIKLKDPSSRLNGIKVKVSKRKAFNRDSKFGSEKKQSYILKKSVSMKKDYTKEEKSYTLPAEVNKEVPLPKRERSQSLENKDVQELKKEKILPSLEVRKDNHGVKLKGQDVVSIKEKSIKLKLVDSPSDVKEKHSFGSVFKLGVREQIRGSGIKEPGRFKTATTNSPTTIILSKRFPTPSVQSFITLPAESTSSTSFSRTSPIRSSPRKGESRGPEESLKGLATRSIANTKGSPITLKMTMQPDSTEDVKDTASPDKNVEKKNKLISEWFPKKDLNSNSSRRESAPLIIGLVPAVNTGANPRPKNPAISYERHS